MKLTAPLHVLKGKAKALKHSQGISLAEALNEIAKTEGFSSWSLLQAKTTAFSPATKEELLDQLFPGDLLLIGARPGLGKTTLTLQLLLQATKEDRQGFFFSFEFTQKSLITKLKELDQQYELNDSLFKCDFSNDISASYIINQTKNTITEGSLIAIDYLQLLDQDRNKPTLQKQIEKLKSYARDKKCIVICISQLDRTFDDKLQIKPGIDDVRLPNPLDLTLFNKSIFVHNGQLHT